MVPEIEVMTALEAEVICFIFAPVVVQWFFHNYLGINLLGGIVKMFRRRDND